MRDAFHRSYPETRQICSKQLCTLTWLSVFTCHSSFDFYQVSNRHAFELNTVTNSVPHVTLCNTCSSIFRLPSASYIVQFAQLVPYRNITLVTDISQFSTSLIASDRYLLQTGLNHTGYATGSIIS